MKHDKEKLIIEKFVLILIVLVAIITLLARASLHSIRSSLPVFVLNKLPAPVISFAPQNEMAKDVHIQALSQTSRQWLVAISALLSYINHESLDTLNPGLGTNTTQSLLKEWWEITDRASAIKQLEWLKTEGHTAQFEEVHKVVTHFANNDEEYNSKKETLTQFIYSERDKKSLIYLFDFVWKHRNDLAIKKLYAWDYMRMVSVARWSYAAGYLSEDEAWQYLLYAGKNLQKLYGSWKELGDNYVLGRTFWLADGYHPEYTETIQWLTTSLSSPWQKIPWNTDLSR